jgi:hypothetical protein
MDDLTVTCGSILPIVKDEILAQLIIQMGNDPNLPKGELSLSQKQERYLTYRCHGSDHLDAAESCKLSPIELAIWIKQPFFSMIWAVVREAEALQAEAVTWSKAMTDGNASIERMFAIKSRKHEYRDNAPPPVAAITQIRISLDGKDFDVSADCKQVGADDSGD